MKMIISPAKNMIKDSDSFDYITEPVFMNKTIELLRWLKSKNYDELKSIWKCNDKIAKLNYERVQNMNMTTNLTPAVMAYSGIQYQAMAPHVFTEKAITRTMKDLYILSGFYGALRAMDGIVPYRLEMQAKVNINNSRNLYDFWGDKIYKELYKSKDLIINLASKEYSKVIEKYLQPTDKYITCSFKKFRNGKYVQQATAAKKARGNMVRFIVENEVTTLEEIKQFNIEKYEYSAKLSTSKELIFIQD